MHVDQQGFLFISFPFQLPSLSLCSIYTVCSLPLLPSQPPYLYFLLFSIEQFLPYCALHEKNAFYIGKNTLQRSLLQASNAQHREHLLAHVQVMVIKSVLNTHDRDAVASARGMGAAAPFVATLPGLSRRRGPAPSPSSPRARRSLPGSRMRPRRAVTRLALARRGPPGIVLPPVIQRLTLSVCITIRVRASAPQQLNNLGNILLSAHFLGSSFNYVSGS